MRLEDDIKLDFGDVLIRPKRSTLISRKNAELDRTFSFKYSDHVWKGIPIVASNMDHTGTIGMYNVLSEYKMLTALCKFVNFPEDTWHYLIRTIGLDVKLDFQVPMWLCIDIANGYTERFFNYINKVREKYSNTIITAGNVCTPEATEQIILAGADIVKIGIGPGCDKSILNDAKEYLIGKNPSDVIIKLSDGNYVGYSNKIAAGKDATPKINTNITAFYSKMGDKRQLQNIQKMVDAAWNDAASTIDNKII